MSLKYEPSSEPWDNSGCVGGQAIAKLAQRKPNVAAQVLDMELFGEGLSSNLLLEEMRQAGQI